jgi:hypothetical protein
VQSERGEEIRQVLDCVRPQVPLSPSLSRQTSPHTKGKKRYITAFLTAVRKLRQSESWSDPVSRHYGLGTIHIRLSAASKR